MQITEKDTKVIQNNTRGILLVLRLDYISCVLTVASTILVGRRHWQGWLLGSMNGVIMCIIGFQTAQLGFIPANLFCMAISAQNLRAWRRESPACSVGTLPDVPEAVIASSYASTQLTPR
jgi:nicotinamide riboside transporter PnuC